jgi:hypothetical protein
MLNRSCGLIESAHGEHGRATAGACQRLVTMQYMLRGYASVHPACSCHQVSRQEPQHCLHNPHPPSHPTVFAHRPPSIHLPVLRLAAVPPVLPVGPQVRSPTPPPHHPVTQPPGLHRRMQWTGCLPAGWPPRRSLVLAPAQVCRGTAGPVSTSNGFGMPD